MSAVRQLPLRELAKALVLNPEASMEQLAQVIGVSRATLHRMVASRDELLLQVNAEAYASCLATFQQINLDHAPVQEALPALIRTIRRDASLFLLLHQQGRASRNPETLEQIEADWLSQRQRLENFFRRGQDDGVIRSDLPAAWLVEVMSSLFHTAAANVHSGRIGEEQFEELISLTLLQGIATPGGPLNH